MLRGRQVFGDGLADLVGVVQAGQGESDRGSPPRAVEDHRIAAGIVPLEVGPVVGTGSEPAAPADARLGESVAVAVAQQPAPEQPRAAEDDEVL